MTNLIPYDTLYPRARWINGYESNQYQNNLAIHDIRTQDWGVFYILTVHHMAAYRHKKKFGQNFLVDQHVLSRILHCLALSATDNVLEIGPGAGALTKPLLQRLSKLTALEIDSDLKDQLQTLPQASQHLELILGDALACDYEQFGANLRVIGNLPYNISTPLLFRLLTYCHCIKDMHFMLQKEVVNRVVASPGSKAYGRLSVMLQMYCEVSFLFDVPASSFDPPPKVDSAFVRLVPREQSLISLEHLCVLEKLVARAFSMRRKTLANNLKGMLQAKTLKELSIEPTLRPEQLDIETYARLTTLILQRTPEENGIKQELYGL